MSTCQNEHMPIRVHTKKSTYRNEHMPITSHAEKRKCQNEHITKKNTCPKVHMPITSHAKMSICQKEHILKIAHAKMLLDCSFCIHCIFRAVLPHVDGNLEGTESLTFSPSLFFEQKLACWPVCGVVPSLSVSFS